MEAVFVNSVGADCLIRVDGQSIMVLCAKLRSTPGACPVDQSPLSPGDRVLLQIVDHTGVVRVWPASVTRIHANARVQILMDGLRSRQTVDRGSLVRL